MTDRSRAGGTVFAQVVVAALFLAVIGGSVGLVLGLRDRVGNDNTQTLNLDPGQTGTATPGGDSQGQGGDQSPSAPDTPSASASPSYTGGSTCPQQTVAAAGQGALARVLYIQTSASEVWICQDAQGDLFYQGHRGQPGETLAEGVNALFLSQVATEGDGYVATNPKGDGGTTTYHVTRQDLKIDNPGTAGDEDQPVIQVLG